VKHEFTEYWDTYYDTQGKYFEIVDLWCSCGWHVTRHSADAVRGAKTQHRGQV
jgi:hypothetical protein